MVELMTDEEIHRFGVKIVFEQLKKEGYEIVSVDAGFDRHRATCYFASVGLAYADGENDEEMSQPVRGGRFHVSYDGLLILTLSNRVSVLEERSKAEDFDGSKKSGPLTEVEQTYLFRCLAVIGSGTYELKEAPQEQIAVLRSVLRAAKETGADLEADILSHLPTVGFPKAASAEH